MQFFWFALQFMTKGGAKIKRHLLHPPLLWQPNESQDQLD